MIPVRFSIKSFISWSTEKEKDVPNPICRIRICADTVLMKPILWLSLTFPEDTVVLTQFLVPQSWSQINIGWYKHFQQHAGRCHIPRFCVNSDDSLQQTDTWSRRHVKWSLRFSALSLTSYPTHFSSAHNFQCNTLPNVAHLLTSYSL